MASVLDSIPGLGGYLGMRNQLQGDRMAQMQQLQALGGLLGQFQQQALQEQQAQRLKAEDARRAATDQQAANIFQQYLAPQTQTVAAPAQEDPLTGLTVGGRPFEQQRAPDIRGAALAFMQNPALMPQGAALFNAAEARDARAQATQEAGAARREALTMQIQAAKERQDERLAAQLQQQRDRLDGQEQMMRLAASLRPAPQPRADPLVEIADPTDPTGQRGIYTPQSQAAGKMAPRKAASDKPLTEFQGKSMLYGTRAAEAHNILKSLESGVNTSALAAGQAASNVPLVGQFIGSRMMGPEAQRIDQAQRNFVNAVLRQESGAVISDQEFANAKKQYFPAPGDTADVIEQKRRNREMAVKGFQRMSGPAGPEIDAVLSAGPPQLGATPAASGTVRPPLDSFKR